MYAAAYRQRARRSRGNRERLRRLRRGATGSKAAPAVGERTRALLAADSVPSQNWDWRFKLVVSGRLASPKDKSVPALSKGPQPISTRSSDGGTDLPTALDRRPLVHFEGPSEGDRARPIDTTRNVGRGKRAESSSPWPRAGSHARDSLSMEDQAAAGETTQRYINDGGVPPPPSVKRRRTPGRKRQAQPIERDSERPCV